MPNDLSSSKSIFYVYFESYKTSHTQSEAWVTLYSRSWKCVTESKQLNKFLLQHSCDCRPARTVIVGGLENPKMVQSVIAKAKKLGPVEDVRHPLDEAELISRGNISNLGHFVVC